MEGGMTCVKYLMFFFNLLTFIAGAALLGTGIWVAVSADTFKQLISSDPVIFNSVYIIIAVGAALFLIGFLGCCGAVNENRCLLGTFFVLVLILFIVQVVGAILLIVYRSRAEEVALDSLRAAANGTSDADKEAMKTWNAFQGAFKCCGMEGPSDWGSSVPLSCYVNGTATSPMFDVGCKDVIMQMFWVVAGIAIGILVVELLAMIFSCCLYRAIGEEKGFA